MLQWWGEAVEQLRAFSASFLGDLHREPRQREALYAVLRARKASEISDAEASTRLERSPSWVWTAMDPPSTRLVVVEVGRRPLAQRVVHQGTEVLAPGGVPLLLTEGFKEYRTAILAHFGSGRVPLACGSCGT